MDTNGDIQWQKSLGGSNYDYANSIIQTTDGKYIMVGYSSSNDGDVSGNHGSHDYWIVKFNYMTYIKNVTNTSILVSLYPNPVKNTLTVEFNNPQINTYTVRLVDVSGKTVYSTTTTSPKLEIYRRGLPSGVYSVVITGNNKVYTSKIVME